MLQAMLLSHLIGDYVLQTDSLARWKSRSVWGVIVHGGLVTLSTWLCSLPFASGWWPYALAIGALHALIDLLRVKVGRVGPAAELLLFLGDQVAHGVVIVLVLRWSGWLAPRPAHTALGIWLQEGRRMAFIMGYVLLSNPAWVLVHFLVEGMGAVSKSLPGRPGEKYLGMVERGLIATLVLAGQFLLVPLVVAPRLALDGASSHVSEERIGYLEEMLISAGLALAVGLALRGRG
jgi:hypothetical protein